MNEFRKFDQLRTNDLWLKRHGWWRPWYELTDGQFIYGKLSFANLMMRTAIAETAEECWKISHKKVWSENQLITNMKDETIGEISYKFLNPNFRLKLKDGFEAVLNRTSLWKGSYTWLDHQEMVMAEMKQNFLSSNAIRFTINPVHTASHHLPLLFLTGAHLIFLMQQQAAAH